MSDLLEATRPKRAPLTGPQKVLGALLVGGLVLIGFMYALGGVQRVDWLSYRVQDVFFSVLTWKMEVSGLLLVAFFAAALLQFLGAFPVIRMPAPSFKDKRTKTRRIWYRLKSMRDNGDLTEWRERGKRAIINKGYITKIGIFGALITKEVERTETKGLIIYQTKDAEAYKSDLAAQQLRTSELHRQALARQVKQTGRQGP